MRQVIPLLALAVLLAACAVPATPAAPAVSQPAVEPGLPEVTVFRSPT